MKPFLINLIIFFFAALVCRGQNVGINDNNSDPKASAMLDVFSTTKGMLIPRVALTSTSSAAPITEPETSLLVYNTATAGDVTPGYYYWNLRWIRLVVSGEAQAPVLKTANATLSKSENNVLASGNTTLTLPAVTNADNGLLISVKHIGSHTELVDIKPQTGKKIDANESVSLTRWRGRTFMAYDGNWIELYKSSFTESILEVSESGSFTSIAEAVEFLDEHMSGPTLIRLGGGEFAVEETITIDLPYPLTIQGLSFNLSIINCPDDGSTAFEAKSECYFKMLTYYAGSAPGVCIELSGENTYYEIKDGYMVGFTKAILLSNSVDLWLFEVDFEDCSIAAIEVAAGSGNVTLRTSESDFYNCTIGLNLLSAGPESEISILNGTFYNKNSGQTGIVYLPTTGTDNFQFASFIIQNNSFNSVGTFASGFDFSLPGGRDAKVFMENNAGVVTGRPNCKITVANSTTTTTITTANTWYKAAGFSGYNSHNTNFKVENNKITYLPVNSRNGITFLSGNLKCNNSPRTVQIAIVEKGDPNNMHGLTSLRITAANQPFQFSTNAFLPALNEWDFFEIWVTSSSNGDVLTIDDLNWWTDTQ